MITELACAAPPAVTRKGSFFMDVGEVVGSASVMWVRGRWLTVAVVGVVLAGLVGLAGWRW